VIAEEDGAPLHGDALILIKTKAPQHESNPVRLHAEERKKWSKAK